MSPAVRARRERIESLNLSRARTLEQLERATRPAHREMLNRTLRSLEAEIEEMI
jgi:DNA-binding HxlR family transcriptional regulator